jgi:hypothetical protein
MSHAQKTLSLMDGGRMMAETAAAESASVALDGTDDALEALPDVLEARKVARIAQIRRRARLEALAEWGRFARSGLLTLTTTGGGIVLAFLGFAEFLRPEWMNAIAASAALPTASIGLALASGGPAWILLKKLATADLKPERIENRSDHRPLLENKP